MHAVQRRSPRVRQIFLLPALLATALVPALARSSECPSTDPRALAWLDKMSRALSEVDYQGVVTYERGDDTQVMNISHSVSGGQEEEHMSLLVGKGGDVMRKAHPLECVHPGHQLLRLDASSTDDCGISRFYRIDVVGQERVAGRPSIQLTIAPRDMFRYGYRLALDSETGLLMKMQILGKGGVPLERFQFASVSVGSPSTDQELTLNDEAAAHHAKHPVMHAAKQVAPWHVHWLPAGFTLAADADPRGHSQTYTDGLAVFSIFLEQPDRPLPPGEGMVRKGGTTTYTRGIKRADGVVLATLIGEVPLNTARMVVDSIRWSP